MLLDNSDDYVDEEREQLIHDKLKGVGTVMESFQIDGSFTKAGTTPGKRSISSGSGSEQTPPIARATSEDLSDFDRELELVGSAGRFLSPEEAEGDEEGVLSAEMSAEDQAEEGAQDEGEGQTGHGAGPRQSLFAVAKMQNMQGFIRESEMKERIKNFSKYITAVELRNLRNAFSRVERMDVGVEVITGASLKVVLSFLSIEPSDRLMEAVKSDCPEHKNDRYDFADVAQIYVSLKKIEYVKLPSSKTWAESAAVKNALQTKHYLADTLPRSAWNTLMLLAALTQFVLVLYRDGSDGLERPRDAAFITLDFLFSILTAVDIYLWANTVIAERGRTHAIDNLHLIRSHYKRSWLIPDVLSALPLDALLSAIGGYGPSVAAGVLSHLRIIRVPRTLSFWSVSGHVPLTTGYILFNSTMLPLLKLCGMIVVLLHTAAVVFWRLKIASNAVEDLGSGSPYVGALYFTVQTFSTVGYGDITLRNINELWFTIVLVFVALLLNGLIIGKLVSMLQLQSAEGRREDRLRSTLAVLEFFEIPKQLQSEILNYQQHVLWSKAPTAFNDVIDPLPKGMVDNIDLIRRIGVVVSVPLFADASEAVLVQFAKSLISRTSKPEEYVTCSSDTHQGIRWLLFGYVDCLDAHGRYISTLKTGEAFGFEGLLESADEVYNYKALSYCDLLVCPADDFHRILQGYPAFSAEVHDILLNRREVAIHDSIATLEGIRRKSSVNEPHHGNKPRIVALRNLHTKLRLYKECLEVTRRSLLAQKAESDEEDELDDEEGEENEEDDETEESQNESSDRDQ